VILVLCIISFLIGDVLRRRIGNTILSTLLSSWIVVFLRGVIHLKYFFIYLTVILYFAYLYEANQKVQIIFERLEFFFSRLTGIRNTPQFIRKLWRHVSVSRSIICPFCRDRFEPVSIISICASCRTPHHSNCWHSGAGNQRCSTFGCESRSQHLALPRFGRIRAD
jgi:hypothetical protein